MLNHDKLRNNIRFRTQSATVSSKDIDAQLGRRLKLRRTLLGLTQEQVANACDLSYQQVHKYETGQSKLSTTRLIQFSSVLETSVGWFFDGLDCTETVQPNPDGEQLDKAMIRLVSLAQQIKRKQRLRQLIDFAKLLAEADD